MLLRTEDDVRHLGASKCHFGERTCSVIRNLPCHRGRAKEVISDNFL